MEKLDFQTIEALMQVMNTALSSRKTVAEIKVISVVLLEDFGQMAPDDFKECLRRYRRNNRYFPTPADIRAEAEKLAKEVSIKQLPPPGNLTEEQIKLNLERIEKLKRRLKIKSVPPVKTSKNGARYADLNTEHARRVREQARKVLDG